jgi:hypothetical protein
MSSSSGKGKVPDIRSRLRKAFNGVFVTSKHQTAVNMRAIGLLVDVIFRVRTFDILKVTDTRHAASLGLRAGPGLAGLLLYLQKLHASICKHT